MTDQVKNTGKTTMERSEITVESTNLTHRYETRSVSSALKGTTSKQGKEEKTFATTVKEGAKFSPSTAPKSVFTDLAELKRVSSMPGEGRKKLKVMIEGMVYNQTTTITANGNMLRGYPTSDCRHKLDPERKRFYIFSANSTPQENDSQPSKEDMSQDSNSDDER